MRPALSQHSLAHTHSYSHSHSRSQTARHVDILMQLVWGALRANFIVPASFSIYIFHICRVFPQHSLPLSVLNPSPDTTLPLTILDNCHFISWHAQEGNGGNEGRKGTTRLGCSCFCCQIYEPRSKLMHRIEMLNESKIMQ